MKILTRSYLLSLALLLALGPAPAAENLAVPGQVQFAGRILTTEDTEGTEGIRGVTFSLFAEQSGGAALWVESQNVSVSGDGAYSTLLGAETQGGIPQSIFSDSGASGAARWLEVTYTGADGVQVTQPRVLLVSVPYALKAGDAATLGGLPASAFVLNGDAVASRVSDNGGLAATSDSTPGARVSDSLPTAAVTAGSIAKFNSTNAADVVDSIITEASGKIGIGTTTPVGTIDVGGWASIPGDIQGVGSTISGDVFMGNTNGGIGRFRMASNALQGFFSWNQYYNGTNHKGMDATAPGWRVNIGGTGAEDAYYVERSPATAGGHVPARLFVVNGNGNVGINTGTAAPLGTLDVGGWPAIPNDIQGVGSTISGDVFMGNTNGGIGRYRMASNALQGFFSWNQYYNGVGHKGMDATAPGWRINVGGTGIEDAFYVERSPATAGLHAPARLFQVSGNGNVGIGTTAPTAPLHVVGNTLTTGTATVGGFTLNVGSNLSGKVLTSDANGVGTWQTPAGGGGGATLGANTFTGTQTISSGNLVLPATASNGLSGVFLLGGTRFLNAAGTSSAFVGSAAGNLDTTGFNNTALGANALNASVTGNNNTAVGKDALLVSNGGAANTAVGAFALRSATTGGSNTAIGMNSLRDTTTGGSNTAAGLSALQGNTTGTSNSALGNSALSANTIGGENTAAGSGALGANVSGNNNTAVGSTALSQNTASNNTATGKSALFANTLGTEGGAFGMNALIGNTTGDRNAGFGASALLSNTTGSLNSALGFQAGYGNIVSPPNPNISGSSNTFLGALSGPGGAVTQYTNATAIGANATVAASNAVVLGSINGINGAVATASVGIGTAAPSARLEVAGGNIKVSGGGKFEGDGSLLTNLPGGGGGAATDVNCAAPCVASSEIVDGTIADADIAPAAAIAPTKIAGTAATLGANNFTGTQTITGNLNTTGTVTTTNLSCTNCINSSQLDDGTDLSDGGDITGDLNVNGTVDINSAGGSPRGDGPPRASMSNAGPTRASIAGVNLKINGATMVGDGGVIGFSQNPNSPNVVIGFGSNVIDANVVGGAIGGGGAVGTFGNVPTVAHRVSDNFGTVSGGSGNKAGNLNLTLDDAAWASVGGGVNNSASAQWATVGGGFSNEANGLASTVAGGYDNTASSGPSTVAGGQFNAASGGWSGVGGGARNIASGELAYVGGGGGVDNASMSNTASGNAAFIGGGQSNLAGGTFGSIGGGQSNVAGSNTNTLYTTVGGGWSNAATGVGATIAGGYDNTVSGPYSFIGGGFTNSATLQYSVVGGGESNQATDNWTTIAGGKSNLASFIGASVGGGLQNTASESYATVPGGYQNTASAPYTFAAGRQAKATLFGSFVWGDGSAFDISSSNLNEFTVRAVGGSRFISAINGSGTPTAGVTLASGNSSWSALSDRNSKENFAAVSGPSLLEKLNAIPILTWNYKTQDPSIRHMGPMAQDLYAAFGLGEDDRHIDTVDADGVALAGVQALYRQMNAKLAEKDAQLAAHQAEIDELREMLMNIQRQLGTHVSKAVTSGQ